MNINQKRLLDTFVKLVSIDSPSYREREMCDELKKRLQQLGLTVEEDDTAERSGSNCGNLIAKFPGTVDIPPILFCCHMDTVSPACGKKAVIHADGTITSAGDTVLGADDLSGVSGILEALQVIREENITHGPIEIVFTTCEEVYGNGVAALDMSRISAKDAYVFDLTGKTGRAAKKAPTIISFNIEIRGKASHAGSAYNKGISAIKEASHKILAIEEPSDQAQITYNCGMIKGGTSPNTVPEKVEFTLYNRYWKMEQRQEIKNHVEGIIAQSFIPGTHSTFDVVGERYPMEATEENYALAAHIGAVSLKYGFGEKAPVLTSSGSDASYTTMAGAPSVCTMGPAGGHIHSKDEYMKAESLVNSAKLVAAAIVELPEAFGTEK